jgi:NADH:ubiquinone oxidoreductase subunit 3 (subunit A)
MATGWDAYYVILLAGFTAILLPFVLNGLSIVLRPINRSPSAEVAVEKARPEILADRQRVNTRFFIAINGAILLISLSVLLIPITAVIQNFIKEENFFLLSRGIVSLVVVSGFLGLALFYAFRKGDLSWLKSFRKKSNQG